MKIRSLVWFGLLALALAVAFSAFLAPRETANALSVVVVLALSVFAVANIARQSRRGSLMPALNTLPSNLSTSQVSRRFKATAALATRNLFVKQGADDEHIAAIAATSDKPVGVLTDEAAAAEDPVNVVLPGATNRTVLAVAGAAIAALNADMYITAAGKIVIKPTAAGTYWRVGRNKTLADADGDPVELELCTPRKLIVIAALTSTNGTAAAASASLANLAAEAEKIGDDVRAIAAALDGDADVALATT